ncbi:hypothetical protein EI94DRAFT_1740621 [Lactarius quietus]|nr:hypothetical protein EI94DRAFT_1740621 [Lactarius quietus]
MYLKGLWYFGRALIRLRNSVPLPSQICTAFSDPEIRRHIYEHPDLTVRVTGHCVRVMVVIKLAADINSRTDPISDAELACLSTILDIESRDVKFFLSQPSAITLANMISFMFDEISILVNSTVPPDVLDLVQKTLCQGTASLALSTQGKTILHLAQPIDIVDGSDSRKLESILLSSFYDLLNMCTQMTSPLPEELEVPTRCVQMCLKGLWYFGRVVNRFGNSVAWQSSIRIAFSNPETTRHIREHPDLAIRVIGHCVEMLVVNKFAADIKSRASPIRDADVARLSANIGPETRDVTLILRQPGIVALANIVSLTLGDHAGTLVADTMPSDVLDMVQQTLDVLSYDFPAQENTKLQLAQLVPIIDGSDGEFERVLLSRLFGLYEMCLQNPPRFDQDVHESCLRLCMKGLWYFSRAFNKLGNAVPLPAPFLIPQIARPPFNQHDTTPGQMARCVGALVVNKLVADVKSRNVPVSDVEMTYLSAILDIQRDDVTLLLSHPGAIQFANTVFLVLDEIYDFSPTEDVAGVIQHTFNILSQGLPAQLNAEPRLDLTDTLMEVSKVPVTSSRPHMMRSRVLDMFLMKLWHFTRKFIESGNSIPLPSYLYTAFTHPVITRRILEKRESDTHVIRRCVVSLVVSKLVANINARTIRVPVNDVELECQVPVSDIELECQVPVGDIELEYQAPVNDVELDCQVPVNDVELECLRAILRTINEDVAYLLRHPGAIQFANIVFLMDDICDYSSWGPTSDVVDVVQQTLSILSRGFPAPSDAEMRLDLTDTFMEVSKWTSSLSRVVRSRFLGKCLKNLWNFTRKHIERGNSVSLPSYVYIVFTHPGITRCILQKDDFASHVIRRCVGVFVVNKLATDINARIHPVSDAELVCLSSILRTPSRDVTYLLRHSGAIEIVNMVFLMSDAVYGPPSWKPTSDVLDVVQQTFSILSQGLPAQLDAELRLDLIDMMKEVSKGTSSLSYVVRSRVLGMFLKNLWRFARAYIERGSLIPLPSYVYIAFTQPSITRRILETGDVGAHVTRCCVGALVVNKLATDINSESRTLPVNDAELTCLSSILDSESRDLRLCLTQPGIIELVNMAFLVLGHVDSLKANDVPLDSLGIFQQTLGILSQALPAQEIEEILPDQLETDSLHQ